MNRTVITVAATAGALFLAGCNSQSDDVGSFTLALTDAPVDSAEAVVVQFSSVTVYPKHGQPKTFDLEEAKSIDLLKLTGNASENLLTGVELDAGEYGKIALGVNAVSGVEDSYIVTSSGTYELRIPSSAESGLKLNRSFTVSANQNTSFTIDFDLRKSITDPKGSDDMILRPTLRIVDTLAVGSLQGTVDPVPVECTDNSTFGAVYVYEGADMTPVDIQGAESDPLTTALVDYDENASKYGYVVGFLEPGSYTVSFTCDLDDPEAAESMNFTGTQNVTAAAEQATELDF